MSQASQDEEEVLLFSTYACFKDRFDACDSNREKIDLVREKVLGPFKFPVYTDPEYIRKWHNAFIKKVDAGRKNPSSPEYHFDMIFLVCISAMLGIKPEFVGKKAKDIKKHQLPNFEYTADESLASARWVTQFLERWMNEQSGPTTSPSTEPR